MILCVICRINKVAKHGAVKKFKICGDCFMEITRGQERHRPENKLHLKCKVCDSNINHSNKHPVCSMGACRGLWYRRLASIKKIEDALTKNDYSTIMGFSLKELKSHGYDFIITSATKRD